jgi:hypothetical protein
VSLFCDGKHHRYRQGKLKDGGSSMHLSVFTWLLYQAVYMEKIPRRLMVTSSGTVGWHEKCWLTGEVKCDA